MAIAVIPERESATLTSLDLPYWVSDQELLPGQQLSRTAAVEAALLAAADDVGVEADDYSAQRISHKVFRVTAQFRAHELQPLTPIGQGEAGTVEAGFNGLPFSPRHETHSLATIAVFNGTTGVSTVIGTDEGEAADLGGAVNVGPYIGAPKDIKGYDLTLPPETDYVNYVIPNGSFTSAYRAVVASLLYKVNAATFQGFAAGSVMLLRAQVRRQTDATMFMGFGFSTLSNGPRTVGGVTTDDDVDGHDYHWFLSFFKFVVNGNALAISLETDIIYVERIWERADLNLLALPGS